MHRPTLRRGPAAPTSSLLPSAVLTLCLLAALAAIAAVGAAAPAADGAPRAARPAPSPTWHTLTADPGGKKMAAGTAVARDAQSGAVYVAGSGGSSLTQPAHIVLVKYNAAGAQQWALTFSGPGTRAGAVDVVVGRGGIYVLGWAASATRGRDWLVIGCSSAGHQLWQRVVSGAGRSNDMPHQLLAASSGRLWACGSLGRTGHGLDAALVALSSANGRIVRRSYLDDGLHGADVFNGIALAGSGRVVAAGQFGRSRATGKNSVIAGYDAAGGRLWQRTWTGKGRSDDNATAVVATASGKAYVVGSYGDAARAGSRAVIRQYGAAGRFVWQATFSPISGPAGCGFSGAALLPAGKVAATGTVTDPKTGDADIVTVGFAAKGPSLWQRLYDTPHEKSGVSPDVPVAIAADGRGRILVAATMGFPREKGKRFGLLAYTAAGSPLWSGPAVWDAGARDSRAASIVLAPGVAIVTGRALTSQGDTVAATIAVPY